MKMNFKFIFVAGLVLLPALAVAAAEEPGPVTIAGKVVDSSGAAVVGAEVLVVAGEATRPAVTDGKGEFLVDGVEGAPVRLKVTSPGFESFVTTVARPGKTMKVVLVPATRSESVTVRGSRVTSDHARAATRTDTPLLDVPQSVTVVTRALIDDQRMRGIADVVRYVPGVGIAQGEGNRDTPVLRGISTTADFFEDGIRDDVQYFRDLYNVERVEVLKGPNAMMFGRGGVGGVINRVPRRADGTEPRELTLQGGAWDERRASGDFGHALGRLDTRVTAVYENSGSYRDGFELERYGFNPTVAYSIGGRTTLRAGYERFHDQRTADRGIPSYQGRPLATDPGTFFGSAKGSDSEITLDAVSATVEHARGQTTVRSHFRYAAYDKFYQNVFPGAVNAAGTGVAVTAYNNATDRSNLFNQTDVVFHPRTGRVAHTLLVGAEAGRQVTDNRRLTGYFTSLGPNVTSVTVPVSAPTTDEPLEFRPSATDADNHGVATAAALYVQDEVELASWLHATAGLRYDRFHVDFLNNRNGVATESTDGLWSPRLGLVVKPRPSLSLYASRTISYLPRAGEQLSSLTPTTRALDPEEYRNLEAGAKWEANGLAFTAAVYRLNRGNVAVPDPVDPTVSHLVDGQRSQGVELGLSGTVTRDWTVVAGYAYQEGEITSSLSASAPAGARLAQLPAHSFSLWNRYELTRNWGLGLGVIHRGDVFASTDNAVTVPAFTRVDAGIFGSFGRFRAQANVENVLDERYYLFAHSNTNITPGSPRAVRLALTTRF